MIYLADANVICEITKLQAVQWLNAHDADIVIDAVVLAEI